MKVSRVEKTSGVTTPPEGGWGWMIVAGCFLATICIRAVTRCVSMFFVEFQLQFERDYSTTAWIHSLVDSTTMLCAPLGGFLGNRLSCRATVMLGGLLSAAGLVLSSFASSLESLYIFFGLLTGLGFALSYTPAVAMVGKYFSEKKTLAYGIAMSGSGIGTFILAPAVQLLIEQYSWRGALLVLGGFVSNLCVCGALMRPLEPVGGRVFWENRLQDLDSDCVTTALDSKDAEQGLSDCSQVEAKQLEINKLEDTSVLLIANGALRNFGLENQKLGQGSIALLSSPSPSSRGLRDVTIAECFLFSNRLTDIRLSAGDSKLVERGKLKEWVDTEAGTEAEPTDAPSPDPSTKAAPAQIRCFCLKAREDFKFLLMPDFVILAVSFLFLAYGCGAPVVYLVPYALSVGVGHQHAAFLMSIFGVSCIIGNITFGWIMDRKRLKRYRMLSYMGAIGLEGLCCMFLPLLRSFSLLVPFSVLYGYFDGAYVALIPVVTSDVVGSTYLTSALGVVYFLHAVPYLVSPPIGGWLVDSTGSYSATFFLSGASFMFSSVLLAAAALLRCCHRSRTKVPAADAKTPTPPPAGPRCPSTDLLDLHSASTGTEPDGDMTLR